MSLHIADILSVDSDGILYLNEAKERRKILYASCIANWRVKAAEDPDAFLTWDGYPVDPTEPSNLNVIGRHNNNAEVPYYEFFCEPFVRFEIDAKKGLFGSKDKPIQDFLAIEESIKQFGVNTYDAG